MTAFGGLVSDLASSQIPPTSQATQRLLPNSYSALIHRLGQELSCAICLGLFSEPILTPCHHAFCRKCLERMLRVAQKTDAPCPVCKLRISRRSIVPGKQLEELVTAFTKLAEEYELVHGRAWDDPNDDDDDDDGDDDDGPQLFNECIVKLSSSIPSTREIEEMKQLNVEMEEELAELDLLIMKKSKDLEPNIFIQLPSSPDDLFLRSSSQPHQHQHQQHQQSCHRKPIIICCSLIKNDSMNSVREFAEIFDCSIISQFNPSVTHLITFSANQIAKRTFKFMKGIISGCWILPLDWIQMSLQQGTIQEEDEFEITGDEYYPDDQGPRRGRLSRLYDESPLLSGYTFYLYGSFSAPSEDELRTLILDAGGIFLDTVENLSQTKGRIIVLCDPKEQADFEKDAGVIVKFKPLLASSWILDCISAFQIVDTSLHIVL